jgi:hypothetical protein
VRWHAEAIDERRPIMTPTTKLLVACLALGLPFTAFAQSADAKYCQALADVYRKTVAHDTTPNAEVPTAVAKCQAGDTSGIPVIEKALKDAKVELPPRT